MSYRRTARSVAARRFLPGLGLVLALAAVAACGGSAPDSAPSDIVTDGANTSAIAPSDAVTAPVDTAAIAPSDAVTAAVDAGASPGVLVAGKTEVIDFAPARPSGEEREGSCFSTSLAVMRQGVYRCSAGNEILDPCFPIEGETEALICGVDPTTGETGFVLRLTEPLPAEQAFLDPNHAWLVKLADGTICGFMTGGTGGVDGERLNYGCTDGTYLVGDLAPGEPWTARRVTMNTTTMTAETDEHTSIGTVWR